MFTSFDKALTALVLAGLYLLNTAFGINLGLDEATVSGIIVAISPVLVWLIPNKKA